jgi:hypothetical protein
VHPQLASNTHAPTHTHTHTRPPPPSPGLGARFQIDEGATLTLSAQPRRSPAWYYPLFTGPGRLVLGGKVTEVYPAWWSDPALSGEHARCAAPPHGRPLAQVGGRARGGFAWGVRQARGHGGQHPPPPASTPM